MGSTKVHPCPLAYRKYEFRRGVYVDIIGSEAGVVYRGEQGFT